MNVLLCIGCDSYDAGLTTLHGAERDARQIFETLAGKTGFYDKERSSLLLSPTTSEVAAAVSKGLRPADVEIFTFFFAGHAGGKDGTFFLCLRESEFNAFSATAFPLPRLFEMVNEFRPRQVNVIIDGCDAGNSSASLRTLLRRDDIGTVRAASVSFLGACAADQFAVETEDGGLLTTHLLRVLRGESDLTLQKPLVELVDIAAYISDAVASVEPEQRPISWGLNLFGRGGFARNPHLSIGSPLPSLSMTTVDPESPMGKRLAKFSAQLWEQYRLVSTNFDPQQLCAVLRSLLQPEELPVTDKVAAISGLIGSFVPAAVADGELLARHLCLAACLIPLLPWSDDEAVRALVRQQLAIDFEQTTKLLGDLTAGIEGNNSCLLAHNGLLADLYYLPLRITRLLGLTGLLAIAGELLEFSTNDSKKIHRTFVNQVIGTYPRLLSALSDEQAPPLYIFLKAAQCLGWQDEARDAVHLFYMDAAIRGGKINRVHSDGEGALEHILTLAGSDLTSGKRMSANPSFLLPTILLGGLQVDCAKDWNLKAFDRRNLGLFFPTDYCDFAEDSIRDGHTSTLRVGFGIWHAEELGAEFQKLVCKRVQNRSLSLEAHVLCMLAAMIYPDRVPFNLERVVSQFSDLDRSTSQSHMTTSLSV
jgi:hypothetical protein